MRESSGIAAAETGVGYTPLQQGRWHALALPVNPFIGSDRHVQAISTITTAAPTAARPLSYERPP
jgi:hypothetical protein